MSRRRHATIASLLAFVVASLAGLLLALTAVVVEAVPAAAQNCVGATAPVMINTIGVSAGLGALQRRVAGPTRIPWGG